ncbi:MAG: co-chaperone GroES [Bacteroidales bacterium]|nr:co-chaperone GroES [Bacteroidales bacterium]
MNIKPLGQRVLVEPVELATTTSSGIIIPDSAKVKPLQAKVVAIGSDVDNIKVNDTVIYAKFAGTSINYEAKDYLMLEVSDILAII